MIDTCSQIVSEMSQFGPVSPKIWTGYWYYSFSIILHVNSIYMQSNHVKNITILPSEPKNHLLDTDICRFRLFFASNIIYVQSNSVRIPPSEPKNYWFNTNIVVFIILIVIPFSHSPSAAVKCHNSPQRAQKLWTGH